MKATKASGTSGAPPLLVWLAYNNDLEIGTDAEAEAALELLNREQEVELNETEQSELVRKEIGVGEFDDRHKGPLTLGELEHIDFSERAWVTYRERDALLRWFWKHDPVVKDVDDVRGTDLCQAAGQTFELVAGSATSIMFPSEEERTRRVAHTATGTAEMGTPPEDVPFTQVEKLPRNANNELHPQEAVTVRVIRGRFDPCRTKDPARDHVYPEWTSLYVRPNEPDVSVFLISAEAWDAFLQELIQPTKGVFANKYPVPVPHDFNLWTVPAPDEKEVCHDVPLKRYLTHPYDWHIFRAPIEELVQTELERIVRIRQGMHKGHKKREQIAADMWASYSRRLLMLDQSEEVPRNLQEERALLNFFRGRRHAAEYFHKHQRKVRAEQLQARIIEKFLRFVSKDELERYRRCTEAIEQQRVEEEIERQRELQRRIDKSRANVKWYMAPFYMFSAMLNG